MGKIEGDGARQRLLPDHERVYNMALNEFMAWFQLAPRPGFTKATVSAWRVSLEERQLGSSSIIIRMSRFASWRRKPRTTGCWRRNSPKASAA
jgi:hypothetical protein